MDDTTFESMMDELMQLPEKIADVLSNKERIQWFANKFALCQGHFLYRTWS